MHARVRRTDGAHDAHRKHLSARVLLSGYYGFGNIGDEALLRVISSTLRARDPGCIVEALSADVAGTRGAYGIEAAPRGDLRAVASAIGRASVVLSGGGGLLQNATSMASLVYYGAVVRSAIAARKRTMIFAQSIGPLDFWGRRVVRACCAGLSAATVRDARSREVLAPLVPGLTVEVTADPVFLYEPPAQPSRPGAETATGSTPLAVFCVRRTARFEAGVAALAAAADRFADRHGISVAFVPFAGSEDAEAAAIVMRACRSKPTLLPAADLDAAAAVIAGAQFVVGVRLHALILAARFGVPFLAVPYDPKVRGLCDDLAHPFPALWTPEETTTAGGFAAEAVDALVDGREAEALRLRTLLPEVQARARRNFEVLEEIA